MDQQKLLNQIRLGGAAKEKAIEELYKHFSPMIYGYYARSGINIDDVKELVQNVFVQVIRKIHAFRGDSKVSTWLGTVARNERLMYFRKKQPVFEDISAHPLEGDEPSGEHCYSQKSMEECVQDGFRKFAKAERDKAEVLRLVNWYGWSIKDVAEHLGKKLGATREYLSQSRKKLKPFIAHCYEFITP